MNRKRVTTVLIAAALMAAGLALAQQTFQFKDRVGNLSLSNFTSFKTTRITEKGQPDKVKTTMQASQGQKILFRWDEEDLTMRSTTLDAIGEVVNKVLEIETARLGGGVTATTSRKSQRGGTAKQTITLNSSTLDFFGADNRAELSGGVTVDQKDPAAESSMLAKGSSGTVVLTDADVKDAKGPVQSAVLQGNAHITLTSVRTVTEREKGKPPVRVKRKVNIVLTGDRVNFQLAKSGEDYGTIVVTGNVKVTGNDTILFGDLSGVKKITIKLDSNMQPYDIESEGDPTTTTITEKKGG